MSTREQAALSQTKLGDLLSNKPRGSDSFEQPNPRDKTYLAISLQLAGHDVLEHWPVLYQQTFPDNPTVLRSTPDNCLGIDPKFVLVEYIPEDIMKIGFDGTASYVDHLFKTGRITVPETVVVTVANGGYYHYDQVNTRCPNTFGQATHLGIKLERTYGDGKLGPGVNQEWMHLHRLHDPDSNALTVYDEPIEIHPEYLANTVFDKDVLVMEGINDSGMSLKHMTDLLFRLEARSVRIILAVNKVAPKMNINPHIKAIAVAMPNLWATGCGFDVTNGLHRHHSRVFIRALASDWP